MSKLSSLAALATGAILLAASVAGAAPDSAGSVVIQEPNGAPGFCAQPCFIAEKSFEVYLPGNGTGPIACGASCCQLL